MEVWPPRSWDVVLEGVGEKRGGVCEGKGRGAYPDVEVEVLVGYGFDVESDCGDRGDYFADLVLLLAISPSIKLCCPPNPPLSVTWGGARWLCIFLAQRRKKYL